MHRRGKRGIWQISVGGVRQSSGTPDRERAKALELKLNAEAWDRRNGLTVPTWDQACLAWMANNPVAAGKYHNRKYLKWWKPHLTGKRLTAITAAVVHGVISSTDENGAPRFKINLETPVGPNATANGYAGFVGQIIRFASNLDPRLTRYPQPHGRDRWLTVNEWRALAGVMTPDLKDICEFALATGLREANDMGFQWSWIHGNTAILPPEVTKTRKPYGIPLNKIAQAVLERRRQSPIRHPRLVFLNRGKPWYRVSLCRAVEDAVEKAGIDPITFHGLRHTFASWLAQRGVSEVIRARLGCWSTKSQADGYSHFDVDSLRPFSELLGGVLGDMNPSRAQLTF